MTIATMDQLNQGAAASHAAGTGTLHNNASTDQKITGTQIQWMISLV